MIRIIRQLAIACFLFNQTAVGQQQPGLDSIPVVARGATLQEVSSQFAFTEGPAVDRTGTIYFTDQPNDKIWRYDTNGKLSVFMDKTGRSNGLYIDRNGNVLACADQNNELWSISPDQKVTVLLTNYEGKRFNGPNDLWPDQKGGIYFTDPFYQRNYWTRKTTELDGQHVYYLAKGQTAARRVATDLMQPNGIVGTPDGRNLYVADIRANKTYRYDIGTDGSLSNRQLFVEQGSDGMTLDNDGNVYLTGKGVTVYDRTGRRLGNIPISSGWTANVCFGGKDRRTLFITASKSVYTLSMRTKGVE